MTGRRWPTIFRVGLMVAISLATAGPAPARTTIQDEIKIGQKAAKDIEKEFPVTDNKVWLAEVDQLGKLLTPYIKRKEIPYTFKILKEQVSGENQIDAFSLPGGPVYFSERLWLLLTRDERLGVLAHEISHVDKRHAINTISEMQRRGAWAMAILVIFGARQNWWDAADVANTLYTLKYSRKREREADMMALDLTQAAHVNSAGLLTAMEKLLRIEKEMGGAPIRLLSDHPATKDRVDYLTKRCLELGLKPEDLEPKIVEEPDRIGNVTGRSKEAKVVIVSTTRPLAVKETVWIKKPLWDEASGAVMPKPVAKGVALTPGNKASVSVTMEQGFEYIDIEPGDGVYPRAAEPEKPAPKPAAGNT